MNPLHTWLVAATFAAFVPAQASDPAAALAKAQLLEQQEGDLAAAQQAYRALLDDAAAGAVHAPAALRLGTLLWRLDQKDAGKPFLERAATAGGEVGAAATAVLQGQGEDGKLAAERSDKAKALVARLLELHGVEEAQARRTEMQRELLWLGTAGAEALVAAIVRLRPENEQKRGLGIAVSEAPTLMLLQLLWRVGTKPAADALQDWSKRDDVALRRGVARGALGVSVHADLEPVLLDYVRDPDPTNDVWSSLLPSVTYLTHAQHLQMLTDAHPGIRAAALHALAETWQTRNTATREQFVTQHGDAVQKATRATETRITDAAWRLLAKFVSVGPTSAMRLFFAEADRYPTGLNDVRWNGHETFDGDDGWLHSLADAARRLGRQTQLPQGSQAATALTHALKRHSPRWGKAGVDDAVTLLELGYGNSPNGLGWFLPAVPLADAPQLARMVRALANVDVPKHLIEALARMELPPQTFPALRDLIERCLTGNDVRWAAGGWPMERTVRGRQVNVLMPVAEVLSLLQCVAENAPPEGAAWLGELALRHPNLAGYCADCLRLMSARGAGEPAHKELRTLLAWDGTDQNELQPKERSAVFAELARVGDTAAIPLFPRAYELGLTVTRPYYSGRIGSGKHKIAAAGIGFLAMEPNHGRKPNVAYHGYAEADLIAAWRTLLQSPIAERIWPEFDSRNRVVNGEQADFVVPAAVVSVALEHLPALWRTNGGDSGTGLLVHQVVDRVGAALVITAAAGLAADQPLGRQLRALLRAEPTLLAQQLFGCLPKEVARSFADEGRDILRRTPHYDFISRLQNAGIELRDDDWTAALTSVSVNVREEALNSLPRENGARLRTIIEAQLAHDAGEVRTAACLCLQRVFGADAVPALLPLLQDPNGNVRKYAREGLDQLRQDAEQRAFWNTASSGVDLRPASAAAKLLTQAKAGEPKEQRLLAIRSLAVLAAAESLPYLIDATKDQDPDIAAAARAAIAQIHSKSGTTEPAKK